MIRNDVEGPVQRVPVEYFKAEFGPIDGTVHASVLGPRIEGTPAFLIWPRLLEKEDAL